MNVSYEITSVFDPVCVCLTSEKVRALSAFENWPWGGERKYPMLVKEVTAALKNFDLLSLTPYYGSQEEIVKVADLVRNWDSSKAYVLLDEMGIGVDDGNHTITAAAYLGLPMVVYMVHFNKTYMEHFPEFYYYCAGSGLDVGENTIAYSQNGIENAIEFIFNFDSVYIYHILSGATLGRIRRGSSKARFDVTINIQDWFGDSVPFVEHHHFGEASSMREAIREVLNFLFRTTFLDLRDYENEIANKTNFAFRMMFGEDKILKNTRMKWMEKAKENQLLKKKFKFFKNS